MGQYVWGEPCVGTGVIPDTFKNYFGKPQLWQYAEINMGRVYPVGYMDGRTRGEFHVDNVRIEASGECL